MALVDDVQTFLAAQTLVDGATGWTSVRRRVLDTPDQIVVITEDGGREPELSAASGLGDSALQDPSVQVRVRAGPWDGDAALAKAEAIHAALHARVGAVGSTTALRIQGSAINPPLFDDNHRPEFFMYFRFMMPV